MKPEEGIAGFVDIYYYLGVLPKIISLCLLPNLLLFFIFIWTNKLKAGKGVITSMFVYGLVILILKII